MRRTTGRLADGREIIYFDHDDAPPRVLHDPRELPPVSTQSEIRYDVVSGEWVDIAGHRQARTFQPPTDQCPLCPSQDGRQTEVPSPDYDVVVFENRFPSFALNAADTPPFVDPSPSDPTGLRFPRRAGRGRCEVVLFTSHHDGALAELPVEHVRLVLDAWVERTAALSALPETAQVYVFENRGEEIGVTLAHPHGQIYAYPYITPNTQRALASARAYRESTGRNLFDDVLAAEAHGPRVVARTEHWTAFVPAAARWPFEVHVYPRRRVPDLTALTPEELDDLAPLYRRLLRAVDGVYGVRMPYISGWHQAPVRGDDHTLAALHLELFSILRAPGKLKYLAGSESGMGAFINDVTPERAAELIREAMP